MSTRRDFLKTSAIIAAGTILPHRLYSNFNEKPKVVVIGAGLAGLSAANKLQQNGFDVTILEGRNRIGGRVFSFEIDKAEKLVIELGAEWVGESHNRIKELCKEFGLVLENNQFETHLILEGEYFAKDKWDYSAEWKTKYAKLMADYKQFTVDDKKKIDKTDWWRYLMNMDISARDLTIRELLDSTDFGESIRHVSAYAAMAEYAESSEHNEMDYKIKGGNSMLTRKLAEKIGADNIYLSHKVSVVNQQGKEISVICESGKEFKGSYVVCAIPTFSISRIKWNPVLPQEFSDSIGALQYARISKHAILFKERFWKDESFDMVTDTYGHYFYHATKNQKSHKGVLISYTAGDKSEVMARQKDKMRTELISSALKPAFGDITTKIEKHMDYYWGSDRFSYGAYALYNKGQWYKDMPILKSKFMNVHFAGEHLADWQGFMEGAINSGEDAAAEIIG